ncbi:universal stress protein [Lacinutrix sp. Bg11-31]|uniref:universal stress protein n=1 Tax=Lacinutrix sp. Bg11-31 TaxID=2057808 RepID=UPI000C3164F5|nr:universal stress protein [Lacinutrix sp. Bg11-31]AUC81155.1 universal stress protein, UspA family [Lacinutrix sp. Bg11-31]
MKRILLPTDFSDNASSAISYAVQLFKDIECKFYFLHAYTPTAIYAGNIADSYAALKIFEIEKENINLNFKKTEESIKKEFSNNKHTFTSISAFNLLVPEMKELIEENDIDLVIMGTKGATGAKEIFLGSNTMYAIKKIKCPVIAVPSGYKYQQPKEILFPTDYKVEKSNRYLEFVREICSLHGSKLHFLNAYYHVPLEENQKRVKVFLDAFFIDNVHEFHLGEDQDLIDVIETFQINKKINFLVMIHNKHSFFENLLFKPIINKMVYHTNVPFLVIPSEERIARL